MLQFMDGYTRLDISKLTGLSTRAISFYLQNGIIVPEIIVTKGRGHSNVFSDVNLLQFKMLKILVDVVTLDQIKFIFSKLKKDFYKYENVKAYFIEKYDLKNGKKIRQVCDNEIAGSKLIIDLREVKNIASHFF